MLKFKEIIVILARLLIITIICGFLWWMWVDFDCNMRDAYARDNYGYIFTKKQCLAKRKLEGHWY